MVKSFALKTILSSVILWYLVGQPKCCGPRPPAIVDAEGVGEEKPCEQKHIKHSTINNQNVFMPSSISPVNGAFISAHFYTPPSRPSSFLLLFGMEKAGPFQGTVCCLSIYRKHRHYHNAGRTRREHEKGEVELVAEIMRIAARPVCLINFLLIFRLLRLLLPAKNTSILRLFTARPPVHRIIHLFATSTGSSATQNADVGTFAFPRISGTLK